MLKNKKFLEQLMGLVGMLIVVSGLSFYAGINYGKNQRETIYLTELSGSINPPLSNEVKSDFNLFWEAWSVLKKDYIDADTLNDQNLIYGSITGLIDSAKDPYTVFLPPKEAERFEEDIEGSFGGIGAEIGIRKEQLIIIAPLNDSPAAKAGLRAMDKILEINGTSTVGIDISEAVSYIRGPIGTEAGLLILRKDWDKPKEIKIIRSLITVPTLKWEMISQPAEKNIAYFKLSSFNSSANRLFYQASLESLTKGTSGVILDLRNNPGGFLEVAVDLAGWFIKRGDTVVIERFKNSPEKIFKANGNEAWRNIPLVILINEGSASASEILAGALRDQLGVKLIGAKTFGKGSVQTLQELKGGSTIKVTVAKWVLPKGEVLEKKGIEPDYAVELTEADIEKEKDPQLDKAIEVLQLIMK